MRTVECASAYASASEMWAEVSVWPVSSCSAWPMERACCSSAAFTRRSPSSERKWGQVSHGESLDEDTGPSWLSMYHPQLSAAEQPFYSWLIGARPFDITHFGTFYRLVTDIRHRIPPDVRRRGVCPADASPGRATEFQGREASTTRNLFLFSKEGVWIRFDSTPPYRVERSVGYNPTDWIERESGRKRGMTEDIGTPEDRVLRSTWLSTVTASCEQVC